MRSARPALTPIRHLSARKSCVEGKDRCPGRESTGRAWVSVGASLTLSPHSTFDRCLAVGSSADHARQLGMRVCACVCVCVRVCVCEFAAHTGRDLAVSERLHECGPGGAGGLRGALRGYQILRACDSSCTTVTASGGSGQQSEAVSRQRVSGAFRNLHVWLVGNDVYVELTHQ